MNRNNSNSNHTVLEIQAAKLAFLGASITTLGDGLTAISAAIALELLEKPTSSNSNSNSNSRSQNHTNSLETTQQQIDAYINELIKIRNQITSI